ETHEEAVPLTGLSSIIEKSSKAVLFKNAGPEKVELVSNVAGGRVRLAAALDTTPDKAHDELLKRFENPLCHVEVPSDEAPVHAVKLTCDQVDLTKLPFHPQHEFDGSCYISSGIDYTIDPQTGRTNVGSRRLSLRNRTQTGTNVTAPSDLKRMYEGCAERGEKLPITFTLGTHPLNFYSATMRKPGEELGWLGAMRGEPAPMVKSLTNDILAPADAEMILEGYLDERGYCEPEGPFGEYMGYYGAIHMDPVFTCTAITMRSDVLHQSLQHGSAFVLDHCDSANMSALRLEADALRVLRGAIKDPRDAYLRPTSGGSGTLRFSMKQSHYGETRLAIAALFGNIRQLKLIMAFDEDIDIHDERQVEWALGTRFQGDRDMMVMTGVMGRPMDPSLEGRRLGAKTGFDCTRPFGRDGEIVVTRCAAKEFGGPARFQTVEQALEAEPMYYSHIIEAVGSDDGREVAQA
ncbi:MAG: UbiD family decarboxylase, partial [Rhodospirillales bacterium]|nr:UbiD family decarboxylase [Rhodospirillales bacterium]